VRAERAGPRTWMLVSASGQCQPLKYLKKNVETAPQMLARISDVDMNGPPAVIDEFLKDGERYG
jgi:hypothetical protein